MSRCPSIFFFFFFNDTATTEIYTLSLHDALPISARSTLQQRVWCTLPAWPGRSGRRDRKSTRLNSSHQIISYAVFCLKKKKKQPERNKSEPIRLSLDMSRYLEPHTHKMKLSEDKI